MDGDIGELDVASEMNLGSLDRDEERVGEREIGYWHLREAIKIYGTGGTLTDDIGYEEIAEAGRLVGGGRDGVGRRGVGVGLSGDGLIGIIEVESKGIARDVDHVDILDEDILDDTTASASTLEAQPGVGAIEEAVADQDVASPAAHLAADDETSMTMQDDTAFDENILTRHVPATPLLVLAALDADGVIADIESRLSNYDTLATLEVEAVAILCEPRIAHLTVAYGDVGALEGVEIPGRGVGESGVLQENSCARDELQENGAMIGTAHVGLTGLCTDMTGIGVRIEDILENDTIGGNEQLPLRVGELAPLGRSPSLALCVESTGTGYGDVSLIDGGNRSQLTH